MPNGPVCLRDGGLLGSRSDVQVDGICVPGKGGGWGCSLCKSWKPNFHHGAGATWCSNFHEAFSNMQMHDAFVECCIVLLRLCVEVHLCTCTVYCCHCIVFGQHRQHRHRDRRAQLRSDPLRSTLASLSRKCFLNFTYHLPILYPFVSFGLE